MPGFSQPTSPAYPALAPSDIESIVAFIRTWEESPMSSDVTRREFLEAVAAGGFAAWRPRPRKAWGLDAVANPLAAYPDRDWERVYRDLWKYDSTFTFLCAPNDTHNCLLNAYVRIGRGHAHRTDDALRRGDGPGRQRGDAPLGSRASARRAWP